MRLQTNAVENFLKRFTGEAKEAKSEDKVLLVNLTTLPIGPAELRTAFAVSESILWWRALMQTLEVRRQECVDAAAAAAGTRDLTLLMAKKVGAAEALGDVILDLQKLRRKSVSE